MFFRRYFNKNRKFIEKVFEIIQDLKKVKKSEKFD